MKGRGLKQANIPLLESSWKFVMCSLDTCYRKLRRLELGLFFFSTITLLLLYLLKCKLNAVMNACDSPDIFKYATVNKFHAGLRWSHYLMTVKDSPNNIQSSELSKILLNLSV